jgi:hypothetical protein
MFINLLHYCTLHLLNMNYIYAKVDSTPITKYTVTTHPIMTSDSIYEYSTYISYKLPESKYPVVIFYRKYTGLLLIIYRNVST